MKKHRLIYPWACVLLASCSSVQQRGTVTIEGRGAQLLTERGDPLMDTGIYAKRVSKDFATGYEKGISDTVHREYWDQVDSQAANRPEGRTVLYDATLPERTDADGVRRVQRTVVVPIVE